MEVILIPLLKKIIKTLKEYNDSIESYNTINMKITSESSNIVSILNNFIEELNSDYEKLNMEQAEKFDKYSMQIINVLQGKLEECLDEKENNNILMVLDEIVSKIGEIDSYFYNLKYLNEAIKSVESEGNNLKNEIQDLKAAKLAIESNETDKIFIELSEKYEEEYQLNNEYFRNSLIITVCCTVLSIAYTFNTPIGQVNWLVFISIKILIVAVGITLCTLFLRRSAHAKKLHEKAYQTHVEINAYPLFIRSLEKLDQEEITKELALRYFGNDIDQTQNDKIGDLIQDQLSAGTELIRASAELVKAKSENGEK